MDKELYKFSHVLWVIKSILYYTIKVLENESLKQKKKHIKEFS